MISTEQFDITNKVIILTGASGFLGSIYAHALSEAGANLVLADINYLKCKKLEKEIKKKYQTDCLPVKLDVRRKESIKKMISSTLKKYSKIDVLINNAIFPEGKKERNIPFEKLPQSLWNNVISVNLTGAFLCCQEIGIQMIKQKNGNIINISSIYGLIGADQRIYGNSGLNSSVSYAITKSAILNLTRYLAAYWNNTGIRVNSLSLGGVENNQDHRFIKNYSYKTITGRMAKKDEYVGAMIFLASNASSYMNGANLIVDGGWTAW